MSDRTHYVIGEVNLNMQRYFLAGKLMRVSFFTEMRTFSSAFIKQTEKKKKSCCKIYLKCDLILYRKNNHQLGNEMNTLFR